MKVEKEVRRKMFDVWKNVLAQIKREIPQSSFDTWFDNTSLIGIEEKVARIGVPNVFKQKQLELKYNDLIFRALKDNGMEIKDVKYVVSARSTVKKRAREVSVEIPARTGRVEKMRLPDIASSKFSTGLNSKYTMDNFVVGSNNDLAVGVARAIIEDPGKRYNPFFLYGGPGLGKTHLVHAIGNELLRRDSGIKILYTPINHFYTDFISAVQNQGMEAFRRKFQKLDVLIIDDFQQIVGKEKSQEEFFNIFNDMYQANKQIIVTSDRLPNQIKTVDERLASRLMWAGAFDLQMPSFEDRCAILKSKAEFMGVEIEDEAIEYLAENVTSNIRELEGEFSRLLIVAETRNTTPLSLINDGYVNSVHTTKKKVISPKNVVERVAKYYNLSVKEMCGKSRVSNIKTARQVTMFILSEELQMSTPKIALEVGVKDHTTVMHGIRKIKNDLRLDFMLRDQISEIREGLYD